MGSLDATLNWGIGLTQEEYILEATLFDPLTHPIWGPITVIGTGKKVKEQPTQLMILRIFHRILYQSYLANGKKVRRLLKPLNDSQVKIVRYLEIPESTFAWNGS